MRNPSRSTFLFAASFFVVLNLSSQNFTWMRGSNTISPGGNYGVKAVSTATNDPGGRHGSATWLDKNGNMWLFGGEGFGNSSAASCWLNDLWKYDPTLNQWTWVHGDSICDSPGSYGTLGVPSSTVFPSAREFAQCWTDTSGKFWLLGGTGYDVNGSFGIMQDFWKYDPQTNQWTWMKGTNTVSQNGVYGTMGTPSPLNLPGSRHAGGTWTGNDGHLYLFGGRGFPASGGAHFLNDLWRYDISANQWTWIKGTNMTAQPGIFGTLGTPGTGNMPGGKEFPTTWKDASGALWLFGGRAAGYFNDLWKYDPLTNNWTWMHGANVANQKGQYGTLGVPNATTVPGGRLNNSGWVDNAGDFWLFGGQGWSATTLNLLNDLWRYDPCANEWTWIKGSDTTNQYGIYGTLTQSASTNMPGSRFYINNWSDKNGKPWMMGGEGFDVGSIAIGHMNDVWSFDFPKRTDTLFASSKMVCSGNTTTLKVNSTYTPVSWYLASNPQAAIATGTSYITPPLTTFTPTTVTYLASHNCPAKPKSQITISLQPLPSIQFVALQTTICKTNSTTLFASGAKTYSLFGSSTPSIMVVSPLVNTSYSITGTDSLGCVNSATLNILVSTCVGENEVVTHKNTPLIYPNPASDVLHIQDAKNGTLMIYDATGKLVHSGKVADNKTTVHVDLPQGVYICIIDKDNVRTTKKLLIR